MIVTLSKGADGAAVKKQLVARGLWVERLEGAEVVAFQVSPSSRPIDSDELRSVQGVADVLLSAPAHPEVSKQSSIVKVGPHELGPGAPFAVFSGPCSIDSEERIHRLARDLAQAGATFLRGGAFKPRTSPYSFQGYGVEALKWMKQAAKDAGLAMVTECMSEATVDDVAEYADMVQIGSRNMQNYALLKEVGATGRPVMLKRGMAATVKEWLLAGEYLLMHGAGGVVFCERGIRGFDSSTRNLLDLGSVADMAHAKKVAVIVDPSHASGRLDLVPHLARAAKALGAHGAMFETHDDPGSALSDGPQALSVEAAVSLTRELTESRA
ncbi:MAG: 3-deoxy-7-phosphoheptulonate synthase [Myxococcota bacterium]